jgi:long-chain acyl-CoA synthetase
MSYAEAGRVLTAPGAPFELEEVVVRGQTFRAWKHALPHLRAAFDHAATHGERTFLVLDDDRVSFAAFSRAAIALAHALVARGVRKGDRVAVVMRNLPEWPVAFYAGVLTGAIMVPLNGWWQGEELDYGLTDAGVKVAVVDDERLARVAPYLKDCPELELVLTVRTDRSAEGVASERIEDIIGPLTDWGSLPDQAPPDVEIHSDDEACIMFTSGTTGQPKGALATHRNIMSSLPAAGFNVARAHLRRNIPQPTRQDGQWVNLLALPFFNGNGCFLQLMPAIVNGTKLVLMRKWDPERALQLIEMERVNSAGGVPTIAWQLVEHPDREKYDLSSLQVIGWGGAPAAPELIRKVREVFPGANPGNGWGMTETASGVTGIAGEDYIERPDSAGVVFPAWDIKIVDPDTLEELGADEIGELWARGVGVIKGYWRKPAATAQTFVDGWVRTGDLARIDPEGHLIIVDRVKDMLIRGGQNIYSVEIENVLYDHRDVIDAAVVPIPHRTLGEVVGAVVRLKDGAQIGEAELQSFVRGRVASYKVPERVIVSAEALPRNQAGKILKRELRALFQPIEA